MSGPFARSQASATWAGSRLGDLFQGRQQCYVALEIRSLEARVLAPPVVVGQRVEPGDRCGEETAAERAVGHEADAELAAGRQDLGLDVPGPEGILGLQRRDRMDLMGAPQGGGARFRQAQVADLADLD
jgi:hypothetical protein